MTKREIEKRLHALGLRLVRERGVVNIRWLVQPDGIGPHHYRETAGLRSLAEVKTFIDVRETMQREPV